MPLFLILQPPFAVESYNEWHCEFFFGYTMILCTRRLPCLLPHNPDKCDNGLPLSFIQIILDSLPSGQRVPITVKIILMSIYDPPAGLVVSRLAVCIPPAIAVMVPARLIGRRLHQRPVRAAIAVNPAVV